MFRFWLASPARCATVARSRIRCSRQEFGAPGRFERVRRRLANAEDGDRQMVDIRAPVLRPRVSTIMDLICLSGER
jgi:hypothetical protein